MVDGHFLISVTLIIAQLCRVPVCASVPGRGHLVFLHGAQPGTGRAHNNIIVVFKSADASDNKKTRSSDLSRSSWVTGLLIFTDVTVVPVPHLCPQASLWGVTALWLSQSILAFLRLYHSHSQHISGPCRPREKELLLGHSPSDSGSASPAPATPTALV